MKSGWVTKQLGELCELISGQHIEAKHYNTESRGIGYLTGPSDFGAICPVITKWTESPKVKAKDGDVLITVKGSGVGKINLLVGEEVAISRQLMAVRAISADPGYIHAFLSSTFDHFQAQSTGAAIPGISRDQVLSLDIPHPPVAEQRRIVDTLDEAFEGIATAKANAEKNLQNARALFDGHLERTFAGAWASSEIVRLADLATDITDGDHMPPPKSASGIPFVTIGNIQKETRRIDFSDTFTVSRDYYAKLKVNRKPMPGDVLYTVTGSFGIPVVVEDGSGFCFQRHIALVRPNRQTRTTWLSYLLLSPQVFRQANEGATGTAQRTVSLGVLRNFQVPVISVAAQDAMSARLDAVSTESRRLQSISRRKLAALDELKKSLLHRAFSGKL